MLDIVLDNPFPISIFKHCITKSALILSLSVAHRKYRRGEDTAEVIVLIWPPDLEVVAVDPAVKVLVARHLSEQLKNVFCI